MILFSLETPLLVCNVSQMSSTRVRPLFTYDGGADVTWEVMIHCVFISTTSLLP